MKYIKTYENKIEHKFKIGEYARITNYYPGNSWKSIPYKIIKIDDTNKKYLLDTVDGGLIWRKDIEWVPDYEMDANKYNL